MNEAFNDWWDDEIDMTDNPYREDSAAYWAWEGWKAGVKAEREACAKVADKTVCVTHLPTGVNVYGTKAAEAIRARSNT